MVVSELRGEKIDIIPFNDEPARFVAKALSPARVREVLVDDDAKQATVIVPDDQLSLAIGREGQNARLAARLTGWRVDIRSETEFAAEEAEHGYEEEEVQGRCAAILSNGRRCPNASLPGSRYCGLETHQALANIDTDNVADLARRRGRIEQTADAVRGARPTAEAAEQPVRRPRPPRDGRRGAGDIGAHVPRRRCVGCGRIAPKSELLRIAAVTAASLRGRTPSPTALARDARPRRLSVPRPATRRGRRRAALRWPSAAVRSGALCAARFPAG